MKQVLLLFAAVVMCSVSSYAQPANDECTGAYPIACGDAIADSTIGATVDNVPFCGTSDGTGGGVWYTFTGVNSNDGGAAAGSIGDEVTLGTCNDSGATPGSADYDTKIRVYTGCGDSLVCVGGNDDNSGAGCTAFSSLLTFDTEVGEEYFVLVHGFSANEGNFVISMSCAAPPVCGDGICGENESFQTCPDDCGNAPAGATCQKAITVTAGDTIVGAEIFQGVLTQDTVCNLGDDAARWYKWTAPADGLLTVEALAGGDTRLTLLRGGCASLVCETVNDDGGPGLLSLIADYPVDSAKVYRIEWDDTWTSGGDPFDWTLSFALPPTCPSPSGLSALADSVSALLSWTDNAGAPSFEIEYDTAGFVLGTGIQALSADTSELITGLEYETSYDYYVRALCGGDAGDSEWVQGSFTTTAGPLCNGGSYTIYLPDTLGSGPAVIVCDGDTIPNDYTAADDQACAEQIINEDSFCGGTSWDQICQDAYDECANPPTCEDGIQNGEETGIDCGGPDCPECPPCPDNAVMLTLNFDNFPNETTWQLADTSGTVLVSGGPYGAEPDGSTLVVELCVPDACYDFTIFDSFGDGMCCAFGEGSYALTLDGDTLASGAEFLDSETTQFCLEGGGVDCSVYDTPPVDLTKSFDPVNGVQDRVQVKWFKAVPEVRYSDEDAAACDIKFWPKRNLDPVTGAAIGDPIVAAPGDTVNIVNAKKFQPDGVTPREIFKWPVKFRADGANNNKRADPNIRYQWQVRCACEHGLGQESPWSDVKIFNVPDFDPTTGIYTPPEGVNQSGDYKVITGSEDLSIFPNPMSDNEINLVLNGLDVSSGLATVRLRDVTGKLVFAEAYPVKGSTLNQQILFETRLGEGLYMLSIEVGNAVYHDRLMVK
ncbi:MAG: T9SS type A sorting domain-containing protein [Flavobacteriales bacterium]|nr:T9SS type A sorting domain-containing protein [Flavobacteriales bacterium]